jgi:hypothetical protein
MKQISSGLKTTFLVHAIVGLIFGLVYLLIPAQFGAAVGWSMADPMAFRLVGAAVLTFALSSWLAYRAQVWDRVDIVVVMEIVWTVLGTLVTLWALLSGAIPAIGWLNAVILAAFAVAFGYFYSRR